MGAKKAVSWKYANLWPLPATTVMVSCIGNERPANIITIAACGIASASPPLISLALGTRQYSLELINEVGDFVVNIPSVEQAQVTDWCGCVSGRDTDKFKEGRLTPGNSIHIRSPYIVECPVNFECKLWSFVHCGSHDLVLGEIVQVHIDQHLLTSSGDRLDPTKLNPLLSLQMEYWSVGHTLGGWGQVK